jgi:serpin B
LKNWRTVIKSKKPTNRKVITEVAVAIACVVIGWMCLSAGNNCYAQPPIPAANITSVSFSGGSDNYTLTINGTEFGSLPGSVPFDGVTPYFRLFEAAQLGAGEWGYPGDANPLTYQSWSDTQIQISGLAAQPGDAVQIWVSNPTTGSSATWGGNIPGGSGNPQITSVNFSGSGANLQVQINGLGFGNAPAAMPFTGDLNQFLFADQRTHSGAGAFEAGGERWGHGQPDPITVKFQSWSDNKIIIDGFAGSYGQDNATIQNGDPIYIVIWKASDTSQTGPQTAWGGFVSPNPTGVTENQTGLSSDLQEVMTLSHQQMDDDVITNYIKSTGKSYKLSADDIIYLNSQGVSQGVISALLQTAITPTILTPPSFVPTPTSTNPPPNVTPVSPGLPPLADNSSIAGSTTNVPNDDVVANNNFAFDLYSRLANQPGNLFFSPYSIETALAMTWAGARGETADQMSKVLHLSGDAGDIHAGFAALIKNLNAGEQPAGDFLHDAELRGIPYQLFMANSLWCQQGYPFRDDFLKIVRDQYDAGLNQVDFVGATEPARQQINDWVAKQTQDKIENLIPRGGIDALTRLVLANAIYFKGHWRMEFDKSQTQAAPFYSNPSQTISVRTMNVQDRFGYTETENLQMLELPYFAEKMSMIVLLPKKVDGLPKLEQSLNAARMDQLLAQMQAREVNVFLPKFKLTSQFSLADTLHSMGMADAFSPQADFSGISSLPSLYIGAVLHKAYVDVDEEGTEAAAATAVIAVASAVEPPRPSPVIFRADHSFLFFIRHDQTGAILFMGRVTSP